MSLNLKTYQSEEVGRGILLEKVVDLESPGSTYLINGHNKHFAVVEFRLDFGRSKHIKILGQKGPVVVASVGPFAKTTLAKVEVAKNSEVLFSYQFAVKLPSVSFQKDAIEPFVREIARELSETQAWKKVDLAGMEDPLLREFLGKAQRKFIDPDFPPTNASIGMGEADFARDFGCLVHWRKLRTLIEKAESDFFEANLREFTRLAPDPNDVKQGILNNAQALSAISVIAEHPSLVHRLLDFEGLTSDGYVRARLSVCGEWKSLLLDEYIPCFPLGDPLFSRNLSSHVWFTFLEKALAKHHGGYIRLVPLHMADCLVTLTGCPVFTYHFSDQVILSQIQNDNFWNILKEWLVLQFLVTVGVGPKPNLKEVPALPVDHSFQVHRIVAVEGKKIISIRNPWTPAEFKGEWAEGSPLWTPDLLKAVQPDFHLFPNNFWISWEVFLRNFDEINVCKVSGWSEATLRGKFVTLSDEADPDSTRFVSSLYYLIRVAKKTNVICGIHQPDEANRLNRVILPYVDIGLAILRQVGEAWEIVKFLDPDCTRQNFMELVLDEGDYKLVPVSTGLAIHERKRQGPAAPLTQETLGAIFGDIFDKHANQNDVMDAEQVLRVAKIAESGLSFPDIDHFLGENQSNFWTKKDFERLMGSIFRTKSEEETTRFLGKMGYAEDLVSFRSRRFNVTVHSSTPLQIQTGNALAEELDVVLHVALIQKFGRLVEDFNEVSVRESTAVVCKSYFNQ